MEDSNFTQQMQEICYIYSQRNKLAKERDKVRYKQKYLLDIKRSMQVRDNPKSSPFIRKKNKEYELKYIGHEEKNKYLLIDRELYLIDNPIPKSYKDVTLTEMNMILLEMEAKMCNIKRKIMKHTHKHEKRLSKLLPGLWSPRYVCGVVQNIYFRKRDGDKAQYLTVLTVTYKDIHKYGQEFVANKSIEKMLRN